MEVTLNPWHSAQRTLKPLRFIFMWHTSCQLLETSHEERERGGDLVIFTSFKIGLFKFKFGRGGGGREVSQNLTLSSRLSSKLAPGRKEGREGREGRERREGGEGGLEVTFAKCLLFHFTRYDWQNWLCSTTNIKRCITRTFSWLLWKKFKIPKRSRQRECQMIMTSAISLNIL